MCLFNKIRKYHALSLKKANSMRRITVSPAFNAHILMGWLNVVNLLLEYHVDPDVRDIDDQNALPWAAYQGHVEVARLLL